MTTHTRESLRSDREALGGLLALADPERLRALADAILAEVVPAEQDLATAPAQDPTQDSAQDPSQGHAAPAPAFQITRAPSTGVLVGQVREPIASQRFIAGDLVASTAEVVLGEATGWGMRLGDDRAAALSQAVLDAEVLRGGDRTADIIELALATDEHLRAERAAEWKRLTPTIVEFEEIA
ncbi:phosphonate C-P lyase system protein PhnG [Brevibacterium pityocampae]